MRQPTVPCPVPGRVRRLAAVLVAVAAALCGLILHAPATPARADAPPARADGPSLRASPARPTNREPVTISGRFPGARSGWDVSLFRETGIFGGEWEHLATNRTGKDGTFAFRLDRVDGDETFRVLLAGDRFSKDFKLSVRYESVDKRWIRGDATANRRAFFACFDSGGDRCQSDNDANTPPGWLAAVLVLCLLGGGALVVWAAMALPHKARAAAAAVGLVVWVPVFADLAFGYAIPRIGMEHNIVLVTFLYPLYLLVLLLGIAVMIGYPLLMVLLMREDVMPPGRAGRAILFAAVLAVLVVWGQVYAHAPAVAAGPFAVKTHWLHDAVHTWPLQWPVSVLWTVLRFFATPAGLAAFGALATLSVLLPAPKRPAGASMAALAHGAAANVSAVVVGSAGLAVISIVAFAALVLAAVALMAYVMFCILVAFTTAAMLLFLLKR
ncbi:hypothetical protein ABT299_13110 [Spirillospora sp. NPDC000708]